MSKIHETPPGNVRRFVDLAIKPSAGARHSAGIHGHYAPRELVAVKIVVERFSRSRLPNHFKWIGETKLKDFLVQSLKNQSEGIQTKFSFLQQEGLKLTPTVKSNEIVGVGRITLGQLVSNSRSQKLSRKIKIDSMNPRLGSNYIDVDSARHKRALDLVPIAVEQHSAISSLAASTVITGLTFK